ncbi:hypothetical protein ILUMI_08673 [Ignelater luminosus]|uniref:Uncharacterized protein n=1 Tax=Ignelater luminosus TaxID=2038154 RepID=A0A8K0D182_IGNLU|nr:hypothetical protein ILUMI_08673 [Ignelater luminosus]
MDTRTVYGKTIIVDLPDRNVSDENNLSNDKHPSFRENNLEVLTYKTDSEDEVKPNEEIISEIDFPDPSDTVPPGALSLGVSSYVVIRMAAIMKETAFFNKAPNSQIPTERGMKKQSRGTIVEKTGTIDGVKLPLVSWRQPLSTAELFELLVENEDVVPDCIYITPPDNQGWESDEDSGDEDCNDPNRLNSRQLQADAETNLVDDTKNESYLARRNDICSDAEVYYPEDDKGCQARYRYLVY